MAQTLSAMPTQQDLDSLLAERRKVAVIKATTFGDQSMTFRSLDEIDAHIARVRSELNSSQPQQRFRLAAYDKGV